MASEITHVVLAKKFLQQNSFNQKDFCIGTVFPDIRYLGVIDRSKTHIDSVNAADVLSESNHFIAGQKFHCLVDEVRENYIVCNGVYNLAPVSPLATQSVKFLEDELYYGHLENWPEVINYLSDILPEELSFKIPQQEIKRWHDLLKEYFIHPPTDQTRLNLILKLGFKEHQVREINDCIAQMKQNHQLIKILNDFYDESLNLLLAENL